VLSSLLAGSAQLGTGTRRLLVAPRVDEGLCGMAVSQSSNEKNRQKAVERSSGREKRKVHREQALHNAAARLVVGATLQRRGRRVSLSRSRSQNGEKATKDGLCCCTSTSWLTTFQQGARQCGNVFCARSSVPTRENGGGRGTAREGSALQRCSQVRERFTSHSSSNRTIALIRSLPSLVSALLLTR
jgi:hypothetical protein